MEPIWKKSWPVNLPLSQSIPEVPVWRLLEGAAVRYPGKTGMVFYGVEYTYQHLWEMSQKWAAALNGLGLAKGDAVAVHLPNSPQFLLAYYGLLRAGGVFCPCSPTLSARELEYQLTDCGAKILITLDLFLPLVRQVIKATPIEKVIVTGMQEAFPPYNPMDVQEYGEAFYSFARLLGQSPPCPPAIDFDCQKDTAHLGYTGGTTGYSKGVVLTHHSVIASSLQMAAWFSGGVLEEKGGFVNIKKAGEDTYSSDQWEYPAGVGQDTGIVVTPWFHTMGVLGYLNQLVALGIVMVVHPRLDPAAYLDDVEKYRATFIGGAPPLFKALLQVPGVEKKDLSSVRLIVSGAAPLPLETLESLKQFFPKCVVAEVYGLTETGAATITPAAKSALRKKGTVGLPVFDTAIKIVDPGSGHEVPLGTRGEVCVEGPQIMAGYHNRPEETRDTLRDGWVYTGDIGSLDGEGYLSIVDRSKDMLIYKGYNIYPREIEEVLFQHPAVDNCAVIGKADQMAGEIPKAFVVLASGAKALEKDLIDFVNERVSAHKKLREVEFINELPVNLAGKVLKRLLRDRENRKSGT